MASKFRARERTEMLLAWVLLVILVSLVGVFT